MPTCPVHKQEYVSDPLYPQVLVCPDVRCSRGTTVNAAANTGARQPKLPGLDPGVQAKRVKTLEKPLQADCAAGLRNRGFAVLLVGQNRRPVSCPHCSRWHFPTGEMGNAKGYPDMSVRHHSWPQGAVLLIEMKGTSTLVEDAQQKLCADGWSFICRSWGEVWAAVEAAHARYQNSAGFAPALNNTEQA